MCRPNLTEVDRPGTKTFEELYANTLRNSGVLQNLLHGRLVEMWECEWERWKRNDPAIHRFLADPFGVLPLQGKKTVLILDMREALTRAENPVFGFVECDIEVPLNTPHALVPSRDLWADVFDEMCPWFFNAEVGIDDVACRVVEDLRTRTGRVEASSSSVGGWT